MAPKIPSGWSMTRKTVVVVVGELLLEPLMVVSWCVLCVVGPQRSSRSAALRWALAAGELDAGDAADDQAGNRPAGMNHARGSATKYSGDSRHADADASAVTATG